MVKIQIKPGIKLSKADKLIKAKNYHYLNNRFSKQLMKKSQGHSGCGVLCCAVTVDKQEVWGSNPTLFPQNFFFFFLCFLFWIAFPNSNTQTPLWQIILPNPDPTFQLSSNYQEQLWKFWFKNLSILFVTDYCTTSQRLLNKTKANNNNIYKVNNSNKQSIKTTNGQKQAKHSNKLNGLDFKQW